MTAGHEILQFCEFRCLTGSSLCSLLLRNYSTEFSNADTNLPREQCRFATYTSFDLHNGYILGPYKVAGDQLSLVYIVIKIFKCNNMKS